MLKKLLSTLWRKFSRGHGISILVPFHCPDERDHRAKNWHWLKKYWKCHLPAAEIVMGRDRISEENPSIPFSKAAAVNDAARKANGDIFVIVDADGYVDTRVVLRCAKLIREARRRDCPLWFVPYRHFFRLTKDASRRVLMSRPCHPHKFPHPPHDCDVMNICSSGPQHAHWYGALIQMMSRQAFECVGGWDERFRGWGGEDRSNMLAMDTLFGRHQTMPGDVLHLWHPMLSPDSPSDLWVEYKNRIWPGQTESNPNGQLAQRYHGANGDVVKMKALLRESWE